MAASKPLASAELVDAGESAAARGTGELAETLGSIEQPKRYNDKAQSNDKEQRTSNSLFRSKAQGRKTYRPRGTSNRRCPLSEYQSFRSNIVNTVLSLSCPIKSIWQG
jgi:hypothetical protein